MSERESSTPSKGDKSTSAVSSRKTSETFEKHQVDSRANEEAPRPAAIERYRRFKKTRLGTALVWSSRIIVGGSALLVALVAAIYFWHARDLPGFETLADYEPLQSTHLVTRDGEIVGELFKERRTVVPLDEMPQLLCDAFIAAEDERFYEHVGLDYFGIARALVRNVQAGEVREGASTITQQVVKTFLLSPERRFSRKFQEMILARRLEQNLTKDEILYLYLNQIYFGHGRYGVQEAAAFYFDKNVQDLELAEAAMLAALPRAPNLYSPRRHPHRALGRRAYVLRRMVEAEMVDEEVARKAASEPMKLAPLPTRRVGESYIEEVRRMLNNSLGSELLLGGGLTVEIAMDPHMQSAAERALAENLRAIDKRQGWRGPITRLDPLSMEAVTRRFDELVSIRSARGLDGLHIMDISTIDEWPREEDAPPPMRLIQPAPDTVAAGIVIDVEDDSVKVDLGGFIGLLRLSGMRWARAFNPEERTPAPQRPQEVLNKGDVVLVRIHESPSFENDGPLTPRHSATSGRSDEADEHVVNDKDERPLIDVTLEQHPMVEGALVAIDPASRSIRAMVGGYDMRRSHFNRATQARRQPGSAFKPFVYGAAIETRRLTNASIVLDAPEMFRDPWTGDTWRPRNYDGRFDGDMTLRRSLALSKNAVAVRIADTVGVDAIIDFARRSGIESQLPRFLPLALGAGEVTPLELVNAYSTLAASGTFEEPVLVHSVKDQDGAILFQHVPAAEQVVSEEVAFILTDLLSSVLTEGTGRSLNKLGRPTAGKTGTTDDRRDAWFVGYTAELVAGVWIGFDEPQPLGRAEYGGRAAGPAWLAFMQDSLDDSMIRAFDVPSTVQFVRIDPNEGLLAPPGHEGVYEPFLPGSAPTREVITDALSPIDFLIAEP